ncbi:hypothetical protein BDB01DRAFT_807607 [Pilobolus umbonatus]|nr:hypothetical protein BDB01DRAFT_807607 [Pilobolus umbonatus]
MVGVNDHTHDHEVVVPDEYYRSNDNTNLRDEMMEEYSEKGAPPQKVPFYKKRKYWIICSIITVILVIVIVLLALFVIFPAIAQSLMNKANIEVTKAEISFKKPVELDSQVYTKRAGDDLNSTFYMYMESSLSNTGPFHAKIKFLNPVKVHDENGYLGDIYFFEESEIAGGTGALNAYTPFMIRDQDAFATFAKSMMAVEEFKWTLEGQLEITALSRTATVDLKKEIVLKGMNGFPNVKITSFQLPGDAPGGGISVELGTMLESPSPIGVELGTIALEIGYQGVKLGTVKGENIVLQQGENNLMLKGVLEPPANNDTASLDKIGVLFSDYIAGKPSNTTAVGISCAPDGVNPVSWLSDGFKTVKLNVVLGSEQPLNIINAISMGYLDLKFDAANPYNPIVTAPLVSVGFQMPFGFSLGVTEVSQSISLGLGTPESINKFATIDTPYTPATSDQALGKIELAITNSSISGIAGQESVFNEYTYALTSSGDYTFMLSGVANTKATTPLGPVTLSGINFTVPTTLHGLEFLNSTATIINSLDVVGGTAESLDLAIDVTMTNPSDFSIATGDVSFNMGAEGTVLGLVKLADLKLMRGDNKVLTTATFDPRSSEVGQNLLSTFVMGADNAVQILGHEGSTNIPSLAGALKEVNLGATLPGLTSALIQYSTLTVLDSTLQNGVVNVKVSIANPFSAGLSITKVIASATFHGSPIGTIDQDISSNPFGIPGKSTAESAALDMTMNVDPVAVALLLRTLAVDSGLDTRPLDAMLTLGGFDVGQEHVDATVELFAGFNLIEFVKKAMSALQVDLALTSGLTIGQYQNDLTFSQAAVPIKVDDSIAKLIPIVGQPIVQMIVDGAELSFDTIVLSEPTESTFKVQMRGSITKTGPMDALISFRSPLTISWQGKELGTVTMPEITAKAGVGATFDVPGDFVITNGANMGEFAGFMINAEDFVWEISTADVSVGALGFTFNQISLHKFVTLLGANGFKDAVKITEFNLPADTTGGVALYAVTEITNPSQIGFNLAGAEFSNNFDGIYLGPLVSKGPAVFAPKATSKVTMDGVMVHQDTPEGIIAVTKVFGSYLSGHDTPLTVKGVSGSGKDGPVSWLTAAFSTITIENVILPGPGAPPELIPAITMKEMELDFTKDPWAPPTSSKLTEAQLKSPFGFPINIVELDMAVKATYHNLTVATLDVPRSPASTAANGVISTQFADVPFNVVDKTTFAGFVQLLTLSPSVTFGLEGASNAVANTAIGTLQLPGVKFNVQTTLKGLYSFGGTAKVLSTAVTGATSESVLVDLSVELTNPSNITIHVGDINFNVLMPTRNNALVGRVFMTNTIITPGAQAYAGIMHLGGSGTDTEAVGAMLTAYLTQQTVPLVISGSSQSTPIPSLNPALSALKLSSSIDGIPAQLIKNIDIRIDDLLDVLPGGSVFTTISINNPLDTPFQIEKIYATVEKECRCGGCKGQVVQMGYVDYDLPSPLTIPPKTTVDSGLWPVTLTASLDDMVALVVDYNYFYDVNQTASAVVGEGFKTELVYSQKQVPYTLYIQFITDDITPETCGMLDNLAALNPFSRTSTPSITTAEGLMSYVNSLLKPAASTTVAETPVVQTPVVETPIEAPVETPEVEVPVVENTILF